MDGKTRENNGGNNGADNGIADSWTRNHAGRLRVFYHGTADDFSTFDLNHQNRKDKGWLGPGVYVTSSTHLAETYASLKGAYQNQTVLPLYAAVRNPFVATLDDKQRLRIATQDEIDRITADIKRG